ncbi:hypothetical protein CBM2587_B60332 [Cupriavidus taiwanensis]|uniref:Uncharacterized protein n=1 Tax=Cupriavidus taiwanensis TaxID=164546 RepID=A0A975X9X9_9BURK|nr:hypothetical protein CBM2587_B60332 [Cupriavidus taiwanensis]
MELANQLAQGILGDLPLIFCGLNIVFKTSQHRLEGNNVIAQHNCAAKIWLGGFKVGSKRCTIGAA